MLKSKLEKEVLIDNNLPKEKCDFAIIFGCDNATVRLLGCLELYQKGLIKKIILTGNRSYLSFKKKKLQAQVMKELLLKKNIPEEDIIVEPNSKSTYQNVINVKKLLENNYNIHEKSFILITSNYHIKRCLILFKNIVNTSNVYTYGTNDKFNIWQLGKELILINRLTKKYTNS